MRGDIVPNLVLRSLFEVLRRHRPTEGARRRQARREASSPARISAAEAKRKRRRERNLRNT